MHAPSSLPRREKLATRPVTQCWKRSERTNEHKKNTHHGIENPPCHRTHTHTQTHLGCCVVTVGFGTGPWVAALCPPPGPSCNTARTHTNKGERSSSKEKKGPRDLLPVLGFSVARGTADDRKPIDSERERACAWARSVPGMATKWPSPFLFGSAGAFWAQPKQPKQRRRRWPPWECASRPTIFKG